MMNPATILYKLKLRGLTLADIGRELNVSRQAVRYAIMARPLRGKAKIIRERIDEIINKKKPTSLAG